MSGLISGGIGLAGGLFGAGQQAAGPGLAPLMYNLSGQQQQQADDAQATSLSQESSEAYQYSLQQAAMNDYQVTQTKDNQALQFASSGVTLAGSPLGIMAETQGLGNMVSANIRQQGLNQAQLLSEQGLQMLRQGSNAQIMGVAQGLQSQYQSQVQQYQQQQQNMQSGLSGLNAGVQGIGSLFSGGGNGLLGSLFGGASGSGGFSSLIPEAISLGTDF